MAERNHFSTAQMIVDGFAVDVFGYDPERSHWMHIVVESNGVMRCDDFISDDRLTAEQVAAIKPRLDEIQQRRATFNTRRVSR